MISTMWPFPTILFLLHFSCIAASCMEGYVKIKDWCFLFHLGEATMSESSEICKALGGSMVALDSREKENALTKYIEENELWSVSQQRKDLWKSMQVIIEAEEQMEKFCDDYTKYGQTSPNYRHISQSKIPLGSRPEDRANLTTPSGFTIKLSSIPDAGLGAWTNVAIPKNTVLGMYEGEVTADISDFDPYSWLVHKMGANGTYIIDASSPTCSNWLRYFNTPRNFKEENVQAVTCAGLIFYMTIKDVEPGSELMLWYGDNYGEFLEINRIHPELDISGTYPYRVNVLHMDEFDNLTFENGTPVTYMNWSRRKLQGSTIVEENFGLLLARVNNEWTWIPERDYQYFTGPEGLLLPFICEHKL